MTCGKRIALVIIQPNLYVGFVNQHPVVLENGITQLYFYECWLFWIHILVCCNFSLS